MNTQKILLKSVQDSQSEKNDIENNACTFAVLDRSLTQRPLLYVTTKQVEISLAILPGWTILLNGKIKRFSVKLTKEDFFEQLSKFYHQQTVEWVTK